MVAAGASGSAALADALRQHSQAVQTVQHLGSACMPTTFAPAPAWCISNTTGNFQDKLHFQLLAESRCGDVFCKAPPSQFHRPTARTAAATACRRWSGRRCGACASLDGRCPLRRGGSGLASLTTSPSQLGRWVWMGLAGWLSCWLLPLPAQLRPSRLLRAQSSHLLCCRNCMQHDSECGPLLHCSLRSRAASCSSIWTPAKTRSSRSSAPTLTQTAPSTGGRKCLARWWRRRHQRRAEPQPWRCVCCARCAAVRQPAPMASLLPLALFRPACLYLLHLRVFSYPVRLFRHCGSHA